MFNYSPDLFPAYTFVFSRPHSTTQDRFAFTADGYDLDTARLRAYVAAAAEFGPTEDIGARIDPQHHRLLHVAATASGSAAPGVDPRTVRDLRGRDWHAGGLLPSPAPLVHRVEFRPVSHLDRVLGHRVYVVELDQRPVYTAEFELTREHWHLWDPGHRVRAADNRIRIDLPFSPRSAHAVRAFTLSRKDPEAFAELSQHMEDLLFGN